MRFNFTSASIVSIIGAAITVAVSFGAHLTQNNISAIMTLVGLLGAALTIGGGAKTAGLVRSGAARARAEIASPFHFTPAALVGIVGSLLTVAVSFGLHVSQQNIDSILKLVGLISGGLIVGGALKSQALLYAGAHPKIASIPIDHPGSQAERSHGSGRHTVKKH